MNTQTLQSLHPEVYRHFFSHHELVISLPQTILLTGQSCQYTGTGKSIGIKIPQRIYLGAKFSNKTNLQIHYIHPTPNYEKFDNHELNSFYHIDGQLLKELDLSFEINILAENSSFETEYIIALIAIAKAIKLQTENQRQTKNFTEKNYFLMIQEFYQKYEKKLQFVHTSHNPQHNKLQMSLQNTDQLLIHDNNQIHKIKTLKKWNQIFNLSIINQHLPFQLYSIENPLHKNNSEQSSQLLKQNLENIENYFSSKLEENIQQPQPNICDTINTYDQVLQALINIPNIEILNIQETKKMIIEHLQHNITERQISISTGENMHIITTPQIIIDKTLTQNINTQKRTKLSINYSSTQDDIETNGLEIDQRKQQHIRSRHCAEYTINSFKNRKTQQHHIEYQQGLSYKDGVLFDFVDNRLWILGEKVGSKEIHSQSGTIDLFKTIFQDRGNEISNKTLPRSCYSTNKNAMLSKIILPLKKIISEKTGKSFPLNCYGSINHFYIKLEYPQLPIYYLSRNG